MPENDHPAIHYRLNAKNVTIRLIIDGYFMFPFNGLLFGGFELKDIDTDGRFVWKTQAGDLRRYMGHRAYLEIIDRGDGFAAVDQIRFSHGPGPTDPPGHLARRALSDARADSIAGLAQACGTIWSECLEHWRQATADPEHTAMLAWAARHGLIELSAATAECSARMQPVEATIPLPTYVLAATDGNGLDDRVHIRGSHVNLGDPVPRRLLTALGGQEHPSIENGSGRLELARRIVAHDNPFPRGPTCRRPVRHQIDGLAAPRAHGRQLLPAHRIRPAGPSTKLQRNKLELMADLDAHSLEQIGTDDALESAIANYETAFRMQTAVPQLMDLSDETEATQRMYGYEEPWQGTKIFARQCLLARRLVERGVRFIEVTCPSGNGDRWDQHGNLKDGHQKNAVSVDQPIAALLRLKIMCP